MKLLLAGLLVLLLAGCSEKEFRQSLELLNASAEEIPLSEGEVVAALKDALARGASIGSSSAAVQGAFLNNPGLRIEVPPDFETAEKTLRKIGLGSQIDRFVAQLNRSAELAAGRAKPIFINAITSMSIDDAFAILNGAPDAATRYLDRETSFSTHSCPWYRRLSTKPARRAITNSWQPDTTSYR